MVTDGDRCRRRKSAVPWYFWKIMSPIELALLVSPSKSSSIERRASTKESDSQEKRRRPAGTAAGPPP
jgi:hypothetical protein